MSFWSVVVFWKLLQLLIEKTKIQLIIKNLYFVFPKLVQQINDKDKPIPRQMFELLCIIIQDAIYFSCKMKSCMKNIRWSLQEG